MHKRSIKTYKTLLIIITKWITNIKNNICICIDTNFSSRLSGEAPPSGARSEGGKGRHHDIKRRSQSGGARTCRGPTALSRGDPESASATAKRPRPLTPTLVCYQYVRTPPCPALGNGRVLGHGAQLYQIFETLF